MRSPGLLELRARSRLGTGAGYAEKALGAASLVRVLAPRAGAGGARARQRAGLAAGAVARSPLRGAARGVAVRGRPASSAGEKNGPGDTLVPYASGTPLGIAELKFASWAPSEENVARSAAALAAATAWASRAALASAEA